MDESFLSDAGVIEASRNFVCIRLATYEDESEAEFLKTIYVNQSGELDNTVFVLLSPDTKTNLCRAGRSPNFAFRTPKALAIGMDKIAKEYEPKKVDQATVPRLPQLKDARLGLNVSSCDGLPSVVCVAKDEAQLIEMHAKLSPVAFSDDLMGRFVYSSTLKPEDLKSIDGYNGKSGFVMINPGEYGMDGELIGAFKPGTDAKALKAAMVAYADGTSKVVKNHSDHVRNGNRNGKNWETEIPVTDPGSIKAMERNKNRSAGGGSRRGRTPSSSGGE